MHRNRTDHQGAIEFMSYKPSNKYIDRLNNKLRQVWQHPIKNSKTAAMLMLLGGGGLWLATSVLAPQIAQAYTARLDFALEREAGENYDTLLRRAEAAARAAAQRSFDQDILVTQVSISVSGQNQGAIAPVLSLDVSRPQWRSRPDPQRWATYYKTARSLLHWQDVATQPFGQTNIPTPPPPPTNTLTGGYPPKPTIPTQPQIVKPGSTSTDNLRPGENFNPKPPAAFRRKFSQP